MRTIKTYTALDKFGRIRLSKNFFMRDFMYSEISNFYGEPNIPENPEKAEEAGRRLCEELLEPLNATFGRIAVRSAYRSPKINKLGNEKSHNCASNEKNFAHHIWDHHDDNGLGATACIVIPWFMDKYNAGADWRSLAYWIHDHLPYSELEFLMGRECAPLT
ncbi:peptidase M15 [Pseudomonas sp. MDMC_285]|nr:peptidase M15 [Pseudomonas sp. MDMC_285]